MSLCGWLALFGIRLTIFRPFLLGSGFISFMCEVLCSVRHFLTRLDQVFVCYLKVKRFFLSNAELFA